MNESQRLRELEAQMHRLVHAAEAIRERQDLAITTLQRNTLLLAGKIQALQDVIQRLLEPAEAEPQEEPCH